MEQVAIERMVKMKSHVNIKYIEMPLSVFAVKYSAKYFELLSKGFLPPDALFDERYIVRIKCGSAGGAIEIGWGSDDWNIK